MHNTGVGTVSLSHCCVNVQDAPRSRIDKDEQDMWWPQAGINAAAASHSPKRKAGTIECDQAVKGPKKTALHVNANNTTQGSIGHFCAMARHPLDSTFGWGNARLGLSCANLFKDGSETAELSQSLCEQSSG